MILRTDSSLQADDIDQLLDTPGWAAVAARLRRMIDNEHQSLENCADYASCCRRQGSVKSLRLVLELPAILKAETPQEAD